MGSWLLADWLGLADGPGAFWSARLSSGVTTLPSGSKRTMAIGASRTSDRRWLPAVGVTASFAMLVRALLGAARLEIGRRCELIDESAFDDGLGFDGSSIRGWQPIHASDMLVMPDPTTAILICAPFYPSATR